MPIPQISCSRQRNLGHSGSTFLSLPRYPRLRALGQGKPTFSLQSLTACQGPCLTQILKHAGPGGRQESGMATSLNGTQHPMGFSYRADPRGVGVHSPGDPYKAILRAGYPRSMGYPCSRENRRSQYLWSAYVSRTSTLNHQLEPTIGSPMLAAPRRSLESRPWEQM